MPETLRRPKNWPVDVIFLTAPVYSKSIQPEQLRVRGPNPPNPRMPTLDASGGPCRKVHIQPIIDQSHPANGQSGLFAAQNLRPDTFICFYLGFIHDQTETDPTSNYDLSLDRELQIGVDATDMGNEARFINDYRGICEGPNVEFRDCLVDIGGHILERRIGVFVLSPGKKGGNRAKGITKGEEIVVSYGKGFWSHRKMEVDKAGGEVDVGAL